MNALLSITMKQWNLCKNESISRDDLENCILLYITIVIIRHHNEIWVRNINCNGINWWYSLWEGLRSFWTVNGQWMSHELTFSIILDQLRYVWDDLTFDSDSQSETFLKDQFNIKIVLFQLRFPNKHVRLLYMYLIFVTLPSIHKKTRFVQLCYNLQHN